MPVGRRGCRYHAPNLQSNLPAVDGIHEPFGYVSQAPAPPDVLGMGLSIQSSRMASSHLSLSLADLCLAMCPISPQTSLESNWSLGQHQHYKAVAGVLACVSASEQTH